MSLGSSSVPATHTSACLLGLFLLGALTAAPAAGQARTLVTAFSIESGALPIPQPDRDAVEEELSAFMAAKGREYFPYLSWVPDDGTLADSALFKVRALQETQSFQDGAVVCHQIKLVFEGKLPSEPSLITLDYEMTVVPMCALLPGTKGALLTQLQSTLEPALDSDDFREKLEEGLLSRISLAETFEFFEEEERVVLPLRWDVLHADSRDSEMEIRFSCGGVDGWAYLGRGRELSNQAGASAELIGMASWLPVGLQIGGDTYTVNRFDTLRSRREDGTLLCLGAFMRKFVRAPQRICEDIDVCGS